MVFHKAQLDKKKYLCILQNMTRKKTAKRNGRVADNFVHLMEARTHLIKQLTQKGFSQKEIAFIFNVHPSQITRSLKI